MSTSSSSCGRSWRRRSTTRSRLQFRQSLRLQPEVLRPRRVLRRGQLGPAGGRRRRSAHHPVHLRPKDFDGELLPDLENTINEVFDDGNFLASRDKPAPAFPPPTRSRARFRTSPQAPTPILSTSRALTPTSSRPPSEAMKSPVTTRQHPIPPSTAPPRSTSGTTTSRA